MNIGEACTREVYIVNPGEPLLQAVQEMCRRNVGCVVVVEQRAALVAPIGIVTDRDIVRVLPSYPGGIAGVSVAKVMSENLFTLGEEESIVDAMERLRRRGVRRAPVTAAGGDLVGIVSSDDLLGIVAEQLGSLARLVGQQTRSRAG
jgi:CBS domain-containing protein